MRDDDSFLGLLGVLSAGALLLVLGLGYIATVDDKKNNTQTAALAQSAQNAPSETFTPEKTFTPSITLTPTLVLRLDNNPLQYSIDEKAEEAFGIFQETPVNIKGTVLECNIDYMDVFMSTNYWRGKRAYGVVAFRDVDGIEHKLIYPANRCFMAGNKLEFTYYPFKENVALTNNQLVFITNMYKDNVIYNKLINFKIGDFMKLEGVIKLNGVREISSGE
jgi:hypothetical protein